MVRPELPTASAGTSQAPSASVDNSALFATRRALLIVRGKLFRQTEPLLGAERKRNCRDCMTADALTKAVRLAPQRASKILNQFRSSSFVVERSGFRTEGSYARGLVLTS